MDSNFMDVCSYLLYKLKNIIFFWILLWSTVIYFNLTFEANLKITNPEFKGYVFKDWNNTPVEKVMSNSKSCLIDYSTLKLKEGVKIRFKNLAEYQKYLQSILPPHDKCTWSINFEEHPTNFVLYNSITLDPDVYSDLKLKPEYSAHAFCKSDMWWQDSYEEYFTGIEPIYLCPEGSIFFDDGVCVPISDENCTGDIVARELATSLPIIKDQGHVGIVIQDISEDKKFIIPYIIEVLDEPGVIKVNTMDDFYNRVPGGYWGEKYGVPENPNLTQEQFHHYFFHEIVLFAKDLEAGLPITYTKSWSWRRGGYKLLYNYNEKSNKFEQVNVLLGAKFRCDTFVRYFYETVPNLKLNTSPFITPRILFINLLNIRNGQDPHFNYTPFKLSGSPDEIEIQIQNMLDNDDFGKALDAMTYEYVFDSSIPKKRKYDFVLHLYNTNLNNSQKTDYLLDLIDELKNLDFTDVLIKLLNTTSSNEVKNKLIIILSNMIVFESKNELDNLSTNDITNIVKIKKLLSNYSNKYFKINHKNTINKFKMILKRRGS